MCNRSRALFHALLLHINIPHTAPSIFLEEKLHRIIFICKTHKDEKDSHNFQVWTSKCNFSLLSKIEIFEGDVKIKTFFDIIFEYFHI
jgi:hypothetical protein